MVFTRWDENVLVNVERSGQSLDENVDEIIVAVGTVMKIDTESSLPLLCLENMVSVGRMKEETLKVEVAPAANFRARLEVHIDIVAYTISAPEKADFRVEIRIDFSVLSEYFEPPGETTRFSRESPSKWNWHGASFPAESEAKFSLRLGLPCFPSRRSGIHSSRGADSRQKSLREGPISIRHSALRT